MRWLKLNSDGSAIGNLGLGGCRGLIRIWEGVLVKGYSRAFGIVTSVATELWTLRDGLFCCLQLHLQYVEIELDAEVVATLMTNNANTNGGISALVDDCREFLKQILQSKAMHCFREDNHCTDILASGEELYCNRIT